MVMFPKDMLDAIVYGDAVAVVGSGISAAAGLPSWRNLLEAMISECEQHIVGFQEAKELRALLNDGFFSEVADECRKRLGGSLYRDFIQKIFQQPSIQPTPIHKMLINLPFSAILTTNYDTLLEKACMEGSQHHSMPPVYTQKNVAQLARLASEKGFFVLKLHGHVDDIDSIVLTISDYQEIMHNQPAYRTALSTIFSTKTLIFIGYSLRDPDLKLILSEQTTIFKGYGRRHYALVANPGTILSKSFAAQFNITVIPYEAQDNHAELYAILSSLQNEVAIRLQQTQNKSTSAQILEVTRSPYKFLDYYDAQDRYLFFGREEESVAALQSLLAHKLLILFGQSGVGKTSLLKAAILPALTDRGHFVVYYRFTSPKLDAVLDEFGRVLKMELDASISPRQNAVAVIEALKATGKVPVILLDKFEQLFLDYNKSSVDAVAEFLGAIIDSVSLHVHILVSIREDYFVRLNELSQYVPSVFNNRFHLKTLQPSSAELAIRGPAKFFGFDCDDDYVDSVVRDLNREGIEPPQLQIVCTAVFNDILPDSKRINIDTYRKLGGAEKILTGYIGYVLNSFIDSDKDIAREILKCFVSPDRSRVLLTVQILIEQLKSVYSEDQIKMILNVLVSQRLVRAIQGQFGPAYELSHDYLIHQIDQWISDEERESRRIREVMEHERSISNYLGTPIPLERARFLKSFAKQANLSQSDCELIDISIEKGGSAETKIEKLEQQIIEAQRIEALGTFSGTIAHDFSNIFGALQSYLYMVDMKLPEGDQLKIDLSHIFAVLERGSALIESLLSFARKKTMKKFESVNLNVIVQNISKLLSRLIGENIELKVILADHELNIMGDPGNIEQVVMNLVVNARDSMPKGGLLSIIAETVQFKDEFEAVHGLGEPGSYAVLSVVDTGSGIDKKIMNKIFEPFFTTKEMGKGTGLGLSIVYGIIKQHNGYINVQSEANRGTKVKVYFPLNEQETKEIEPKKATPILGGDETILLAEDDEYMRASMKLILEKFGYKVIVAADGEDAINKYLERKGEIKLLLFDHIMPRKNGKEAYDEIQLISPDIKVIFVSGYGSNQIVKDKINDKKVYYYHKPIAPSKLLRVVRDVLDII